MTDARPRVGLVHATPLAMAPMSQAFAERLPHVIVLNVLDDGLLDGLNQAGHLTPALVRRLATVVGLAETAGVRAVLLSCSAYTPVVDTIRALTSVPVMPVDAVLVEEAVRAGDRLGVIATSARSAATISQALEQEAARHGRTPEINTAPVPEAFAANAAGDAARHDAIVAAAARRLAGDGVDAIVLAQASLSRAVPLIGDLERPVLTSPLLAVQRVAAILYEQADRSGT